MLRSSLPLALFVIGFGLSGFFDGILLHQVLQWHHLLSLVPGAVFRDLGTQILADGLFHLLMYGVTAAGLLMLWRHRAALPQAGARRVAGFVLLGFGVWNLVDVVGFHWLLGIHRIRVNVPDPLAYDLGWLGAFALVPLAIAWSLLRRPGGGGGRRAGAVTAVLALVCAGLALRPPPGSRSALVLLPPAGRAADAVNLARAAGAPLLWADPAGRMLIVDLDRKDAEAALYRAGALFVTRSPAVAGCAAAVNGQSSTMRLWTRVSGMRR